MRVISKKALDAFAQQYPDAGKPLDTWYRITKKATWQSITDVRNVYPHADAFGCCTIFNIGGNKYRLITHIDYPAQMAFIRFVLTHEEYDREGWKNDC